MSNDEISEEDVENLVGDEFIPFLGAGCSFGNLDPSNRRKARERIERICRDVARNLADGDPDDGSVTREEEEIVELFRALLEEKGLLRDEDTEFKPLERSQPGIGDLGLSERRRDVLVGLGDLYSYLMKVIGQRLPRIPFISTGSPPGVPFRAQEDDSIGETMDAKVRELLGDLQSWEPAEEPTLGQGDQTPGSPPSPDPEDIETYIDSIRSDISPSGDLTLDSTAWLGQLFWHLVRYDLPHHPTSGELAFQLQLSIGPGSDSDTIRPMSLADVAEVITGRKAAERMEPQGQLRREITETFRWLDDKRGPPEFHENMARYLRWIDAEGNLGHPPLAFTTNYDCLLEKALLGYEEAFGVTFPLDPRAPSVGVPEASKRKWAYFHFEPGCDSVLRPSRITIYPNRQIGKNESPLDLEEYEDTGPVVVKLHGSAELPGDHLEEDDITGPSGWTHDRPHIVMSERSFLDAINDGIPRWIRNILSDVERKDRGSRDNGNHPDVAFLAYSLSDWNVRLHFSQMHGPVHKRQPTSIKDGFSASEAAFLTNINFSKWPASLQTFNGFFGDVLDARGAPYPG